MNRNKTTLLVSVAVIIIIVLLWDRNTTTHTKPQSHNTITSDSNLTIVKTPAQLNSCPPHRFNADQLTLLQYAYEQGEKIGFPETMQAIMIVESQVGGNSRKGAIIGNKVASVGKRAYGVLQLKTVAARFVYSHHEDVFLKHFPNHNIKYIEDEEIIILLLTNDKANIELGTLNFKLMLKYTDRWSDAVTAYYTGLGGLKSVEGKHFYLTKIQERIKVDVKPLNKCL